MGLPRQAAHEQFTDLLVAQWGAAARSAHDELEFFQSLCDVLVNAGLF